MNSFLDRARLAAARLGFFVFRFRTPTRADAFFAGHTGGEPLVRRLYGFRIAIDPSRSNLHRRLYLEGERVAPEVRVLRSVLRPGMTVVDVGANIGYYALMLRQAVGPVGRVICIEPSETNLLELNHNLRLNALANVEVIDCAVGSENGTVGLRDGLNTGVVGVDEGATVVELRTLDSLLDGPVDLIKIDVEGYEAAALDGAAGTIEEHRPSLFVEVHPELLPRYGRSVEEIFEALSASYAEVEIWVEALASDGRLCRLLARYVGNPVRRLETLPPPSHTAPFWLLARM